MAGVLKVDTILDSSGNKLDASQFNNVGKVLQVTSTLLTDHVATSYTTGVPVQITDFDTTLIAKGDNSKYLISVRWFGEMASGWDCVFNVTMNGSRINLAPGSQFSTGLAQPVISYYSENNESTPETINFTILHNSEIAKGTSLTFALIMATANPAGTLWTNRTYGTGATYYETGTSEIIVTEISGV